MDEACSTHVIDEKCVQNSSENLKGGDYLGDIGVDGLYLNGP
jgi:hypothetical protein